MRRFIERISSTNPSLRIFHIDGIPSSEFILYGLAEYADSALGPHIGCPDLKTVRLQVYHQDECLSPNLIQWINEWLGYRETINQPIEEFLILFPEGLPRSKLDALYDLASELEDMVDKLELRFSPLEWEQYWCK